MIETKPEAGPKIRHRAGIRELLEIIVLALFMPVSALVASTLFFDLGGGAAAPAGQTAV